MFKLLVKTLGSTSAEPLSATSLKCAQALVQAKRANSATVNIGDSTLTSGAGLELLKPSASVPLDLIPLKAAGVGNNIDLKDVYAIGSANDVVVVFYEIY